MLVKRDVYFITGNKGKLEEARSILSDIEVDIKHIELDLPEIQDISPENIIIAKLEEAFKQKTGVCFIVDDTSLHMDCLNGLPGPLAKWFLKTILFYSQFFMPLPGET